MSTMSPLHPIVHEKFTEAFGPPHRTVGKDRHWALRSLGYVAAVNVLINGSSECPVVWVFDPHDATDGVAHECIEDVAQIPVIIAMIQQRVARAGGRK